MGNTEYSKTKLVGKLFVKVKIRVCTNVEDQI